MRHGRAAAGGVAPGVEAVFLMALLAAPWPYGCAQEWARFGLSALLLGAGAAWRIFRLPWKGKGGGAGLLVGGVGGLALAQAVTGVSAAPGRDVQSGLVWAAMSVPLAFWAERSAAPGASRRLAWAVLVSCGAQGAFGVYQWSASPGLLYGRAVASVSPFGSFVSHNHFAGMMAMGAVLAMGMAFGQTRRRRGPGPEGVALAGFALALSAMLLASRSRGGLVALAGGAALVGLYGPFSRARSTKRSGLAALAAAVALLAFGLAVVPSATRGHLGSVLAGPSDASGWYRLDVARWTLELAASRPLLGSGLGSFADALPPFKRGHGDVRVTHAENDLFEFAAETGLVGLVLLGWLGVVLFRRAIRGLRHERDPEMWGMRLGAFGAVGALLTHSLLDFNLRIPSNALVFCSLLGLACAERGERGVAVAPERPGHRWVRLGMAVVLGLLAVVAAWRAWGAWELERASTAASFEERVERLDRTLRWHPYLAEGWRARGLAWRERARWAGGYEARRLERARRDLERALELRPQWGEAWADLGWTRLLGGDVAGAERDLDRARDWDPTHLSIGAARAEFFAVTGQVEGAVEEVRRLKGMNPQWPVSAAQALARRWTADPGLLARVGDPSGGAATK